LALYKYLIDIDIRFYSKGLCFKTSRHTQPPDTRSYTMFVGNDILNYLHGGAKNILFALKFGNGSTNI